MLGLEIQRQVIMQVSFDHVTCTRPLPPDLEIRPAAVEDLPALGRFAHYRAEGRLREWISNGYFVVLAERRDGALVGFCCLSQEHVYPKLLGRAVPLAATDAWWADIYVDPEYRGTGVYDYLKSSAIKVAREHGYTRAVGSVLSSNVASRKANLRIGAQEVGWLLFLKAFGKTRACLVSRRTANDGNGSLKIITEGVC